MTVSRFTWKNYGISLPELKYKTLPTDFFHYEEMMYMQNDYEFASHKDLEIK